MAKDGKGMFDTEYVFVGKHATMVKELTKVLDQDTKIRFFDKNVTLAYNAIFVGYLYDRKGKKVKGEEEKYEAKINYEQIVAYLDHFKYALKTIMLIDKTYEPDAKKRLDKAFRCLGEDPGDLDLLESYMLGGIEVLYENLIVDATHKEDYMNKLVAFIDDYQEKFVDDIENDEIVKLCEEFKLKN